MTQPTGTSGSILYDVSFNDSCNDDCYTHQNDFFMIVSCRDVQSMLKQNQPQYYDRNL